MELNLSQEKELVNKAKKDPSAFSRLYDLNYPKIFGFALKRVACVDIAKDIVSQTFLKAYENIGSFKWRRVSFSSWLFRIASNEIADYYRKERKSPVAIDSVAEPAAELTPEIEVINTEEAEEKQQDIIEIKEKISDLPEESREVLELKFLENKKIREISEITGKREGTIKSLIHRGVKKIQTLLEKEENDPNYSFKVFYRYIWLSDEYL